ncbi:MAG: PspC domain-containing protein [Tissierellales bacterium]|jgi:phage shock protein C|nr:PspC domain-containing protein [Tissierellales bacterium]
MEKKLYKNPEKKKIAGVCQGVAEYFDLDPTIVRVIWFIVSWAWGAGVAAYILLWIILPDKTEVADVLNKEDIPDDDFYNDDEKE